MRRLIEFMKTITSSIIKNLNLPKPSSRKRDNGRLLVIAGSDKYFGALVYAIKAASRIVDLVYVLTTPDNQKLIEKMKSKTAEFMPVKSMPEMWGKHWGGKKGAKDIDCILIGPGLGLSVRSKNLVRQVLKHKIKTVIDADALNVLDKKMIGQLNQNHILTPHHREFKRLFGIPATAANAEKMMKKYRCTIVLKGPVDYVANASEGLWQN